MECQLASQLTAVGIGLILGMGFVGVGIRFALFRVAGAINMMKR